MRARVWLLGIGVAVGLITACAGGTATAAAQLIQDAGGKIVECCFVIDLPDLGGRKRLEALGHQVFALMAFHGD